MTVIKSKFIVPAYYRHFHCLCGQCRHSCCEGLAVNITQDEYFRLAGIGCSRELRERLDLAIHPLEHPDENRYACLSPDFFGRCRMLDENGLCRLQSECGFEALARACRYYPRKPLLTHCPAAPLKHSDTFKQTQQNNPAIGKDRAIIGINREERNRVLLPLPTCAMSNACDETLNLLMQDDLSWGYETLDLTFDLIGNPTNAPYISRSGEGTDGSKAITRDIRSERQVQREIIAILLQTDLPLMQRLQKMDSVVRKDFSSDQLSSGQNTAETDPQQVQGHQMLQAHSKNYNCPSIRPETIEHILSLAGGQYVDMEDYTAATLRMMRNYSLTREDDLETAVTELDDKVDAAVPKEHLKSFKRFFARIIANSIFYSGFPYNDSKAPEETVPVFQTIVIMLLLLSAANLNEISTREDIIDLYACFFRMVDLTNFGRLVRSALLPI